MVAVAVAVAVAVVVGVAVAVAVAVVVGVAVAVVVGVAVAVVVASVVGVGVGFGFAMTREEIQVIIARAEAATAGPWGTRPGVSGSGTSVTADGTAGPAWCGVSTCSPGHSIWENEARNNAIFIAAARTDVPALASLVLRQMDEIEAAQKLTSEVRRWEPCGHYGRYDEAECQVCVNVSARGRLVIERDAVVEQAQVAYEVFRKEGARLEADRDHWKGVVVEVQSDAAVAESNCDALTADLAAARAMIERVEALLDWRELEGSTAVRIKAIRAALCGDQEGAGDA